MDTEWSLKLRPKKGPSPFPASPGQISIRWWVPKLTRLTKRSFLPLLIRKWEEDGFLVLGFSVLWWFIDTRRSHESSWQHQVPNQLYFILHPHPTPKFLTWNQCIWVSISCSVRFFHQVLCSWKDKLKKALGFKSQYIFFINIEYLGAPWL